MKNKEECPQDLVAEIKRIGEEIVQAEARQKELKVEVDKTLNKIGMNRFVAHAEQA
jgi:hypothetical protein